jgi:hypothetical protein
MTSTLRPSLNSKLSFRLVDLTISFSIEHLAILSKLIHYIATCIANGAVTRNSGATFQPLPPLPLFEPPIGAPVRFLSLVFLFFYFHVVL